MSFGDHLEELRGTLIRSLVGVGLGSVICLIFGVAIVRWICLPLWAVQHANGLTPQLQVLSPAAGFTTYLKIAFLSGVILAMPWVLYQGWRFVATGLYAHERRFVRLMVPASVGLFALGVLFLYYLVLPVVLHFFIRFNQSIQMRELMPTAFQSLLLGEREVPPVVEGPLPLRLPVLDGSPAAPAMGDAWIDARTRRLVVKGPTSLWSAPLDVGPTAPALQSQFAIDFYITFVLMLALAFGLAFETPIVVFFLAWTGLVSTAAMRSVRRYVLFGIILAAAMLTPPDVFSQMLLAGPMYLLFEVGVAIASRVERRRRAEAESG